MARYGTEHKEATRRCIVEAAGRWLKRDGIDGSGVATLMADAGLTNGAFYAHVRSKGDLIARVIEEEPRFQAAWVDALLPGRADVEQLARAYLFPRAPRLLRCGLFVGRAARRTRPVRRLDQEGPHQRCPGDRGPDRRASGTGRPAGGEGPRRQSVHDDHRHPAAVPGLADRALSDELLEQGHGSALGVLGGDHHT